MLRVKDSQVYDADFGMVIKNPVMVVDTKSGDILKIWDKDTVDSWYKYTLSKCDEAKEWKYIDFKGLSNQEICTLHNFGMTCNKTEFIRIINIKDDTIHKELKILHDRGY